MKAQVSLWIGAGKVGNLEVKEVQIRDKGSEPLEIEVHFKDGAVTTYYVAKHKEVSKIGQERWSV